MIAACATIDLRVIHHTLLFHNFFSPREAGAVETAGVQAQVSLCGLQLALADEARRKPTGLGW